MTEENDRAEILRLNEEWIRGNCGLHEDRGILPVFVGGEAFQGFNFNGHTYGERSEWVRLWQYYKKAGLDLQDLRREKTWLTIDGDMALLAWEGTSRIKMPGEVAAQTGPIRGTEVYRRRDENGRPVWRMWHCHYSPSAPPGTPRPAFE